MDCPIDFALEAAIDPPALEQRVEVPALPPPPGEKGWYGTPTGNTLETDNFGIVWASGQATLAEAEAAGDALEDAWQTLVVDEGWPQPTLSETYYVWVVLDPYLGSDGITVEQVSVDAPSGYPIITLNPTLSVDEPEYRLAAAHQLMHAIQFRMREGWSDTDAEAWYWEASAVWASARVEGGDAWALDASGFTSQPELRFDSRVNDHHRGMFLLNTYIEEQVLGPDALWTVWDRARFAEGEPWESILSEATGVPASELFAGFADSVGNERLDVSPLIEPVLLQGDLISGVSGTLPLYGAHYWTFPDGEAKVAELLVGSEIALLATPQGIGSRVEVLPGDVLTVLGLSNSSPYQVFLSGSGSDDPTGEPFGGLADGSTEFRAGTDCGCATPRSGSNALWLGWLVLLGLRATSRVMENSDRGL